MLCGAAGDADDIDDEEEDTIDNDDMDNGQDAESQILEDERVAPPFVWTRELMGDFRLELVRASILLFSRVSRLVGYRKN